jgi:hypothetical protein
MPQKDFCNSIADKGLKIRTQFAKRFRLLNSSKRRMDSARLMLMPLPAAR